MALTRAQLLAGNQSQGFVLPGQVQAVSQGTGVFIDTDGTISVDASTAEGLVRLNNSNAYNGYIWPNTIGQADQFLQLVDASGTLQWADPSGFAVVTVSPIQPSPADEGELWYDCNTGYLKLFQNCVSPGGWTNVSQPGKEVTPANTSAVPPFTNQGTPNAGTISNPYDCTVTTTTPGTSIFIVNKVRVIGLTPNQYVPIVDMNAVTNGGRFHFSNNYADGTGVLEFETIFIDLPSSASGVSYTAAIRVGYASVYIDAIVNVVAPLSCTPGSISGDPVVGNQLTYTQGVASGGIGAYTYTWDWKDSGGNVLASDVTTYVPTGAEVGQTIFVELTVTDSAPTPDSVTVTTSNTAPVTALTLVSAGSISGSAATGSTLTYTPGSATGGAAPVNYTWQWKNDQGSILQSGSGTAPQTYVIPATQVGRTIFVAFTATDSATTQNVVSGNTASTAVISGTPITNVQFPTTIPGTASFTWNDGNGVTLTATDCIEFEVNGAGGFVTSATVSNTNTIVTRWKTTPACGGAAQGTTINGTLTSSTGLVSSSSLTINRLPTSVTLNPTSTTANVSSVISAVNFSTSGANTAPLLWGILSAGSTPEYSIDGGTNWFPLPNTPTAADVIPPGVTALVRYTTSGTPGSETLELRAGYSSTAGQYQSATLTTTVSFAPFPNPVWNPTGSLGTVPGLLSGTYSGTGTTITSTGCVEVSTDGINFSQSEPIAFGQTLYARWIDTPSSGTCGDAPTGTQLTGTVSDGTYENSYGPVTINRKPTSFGFGAGSTTAPLSSLQTSGSVSITGINATAYITLGSLSAGATGLEARVNGGPWTPVPSAPSTLLTIQDSNTLEIRFVTGPTASATYTAVVNIGDGDNVQFTASSPGFVVQNTSSTAFPGVTFDNGGGPNAGPETVTNVTGGGTLGTLNGKASASWTPVGTALTGTNIKMQVNGAGGFSTSATAVNGQSLEVAWVTTYLDTLITGDTASGSFTGTISGTAYTNNFSFTVERAAVFSTTTGSASGASGAITLPSQTPDQYNVPVKLYQTAGGTLTSVTVDINTTGAQPLPVGAGSALTLNPGDAVVFAATAPAGTATYSTDIVIGDTTHTWSYQVTVTPTVSTPVISLPVNTSPLNPAANSPAGLTLATAASGSPGGFQTNYSGTQTAADWYVYKAIPGQPETSAITSVDYVNSLPFNAVVQTALNDVPTTLSGLTEAIAFDPNELGLMTWATDVTDIAGVTWGQVLFYWGNDLSQWQTWTRYFSATAAGTTDFVNLNSTNPGGPYNYVIIVGDVSTTPSANQPITIVTKAGVTGVPVSSSLQLTLTDATDLADMVVGDTVLESGSPYSGSWTLGGGATSVGNPYLFLDGTINGTTVGDWTNRFSNQKTRVLGTAPTSATWTFDAPVTGTLFEVLVGGGSASLGGLSVNGTPITVGTAQYYNWLDVSAQAGGSLSSVTIGNTGTVNVYCDITAVRVDGVILDLTQGVITAIDSGSVPPTITLSPSSGTWSTTQTAIDISRTVIPGAPTVLPPAVPPATKYTPITGFNPLNLTGIPFNQAFIPQADLATSSTYYGSVIYTGSGGTPVVSTASAWYKIETASSFLPAPGTAMNGGFFGGQINDGGIIYNLIVAPAASGQNTSGLAWKNADTAESAANTATAQNEVYGFPMSQIGFNGGAATYPALHWARSLSIGSYNDWYLPAKNELEVLYYFLKPDPASGGTANTTSSGSNPNAVSPEPVSTNYTASNPAQTTANDFKVGNTQAFTTVNGSYWSSTQYSVSPNGSMVQNFIVGTQANSLKSAVNRNIRAIRREYANAPVAIGDAFGGGFFAGQYVDGGQTYNLIVAPIDDGTREGQYGGTPGPVSPGPYTGFEVQWKTNLVGDGATANNTVYGGTTTTTYTGATYPMFDWCVNGANGPNSSGGIGGFTDWYIPAQDELSLLIYNLGPLWTTSTAFQTGGTEAFTTAIYYWSATQRSAVTSEAVRMYFFNGDLQFQSKNYLPTAARAVRRVPA